MLTELDNLMEKEMEKSIEVFIHLKKESWDIEYTVHPLNCDMTEYGYILIGTQMIEFNMPDNEKINALHIKTLRAKEQKLTADFYVNKEKIEEEIQSLLSIANKAE